MVQIYDASIDKPEVDERGISDPVVVFTSNHMVLIAWWDAKNQCWWNIEADSKGLDAHWFGNVQKWHKIEFPHDWNYDSNLYGGDVDEN